MCGYKAHRNEIFTPTSETGQARGKGCGAGNRARFPAVGEMLTLRAIGRSDGGPAVLRDWMGTWTQAGGPAPDSEALDGGYDRTT